MRLIPRLDIKEPNLIKSIHLEGLMQIGDPNEFAQKYYAQGADEILIIDCVATLYNQKPKFKFLKKITKKVFCPITIGGGIKTVENALEILNSGADKIAINSAAVRNPCLIKKISEIIGTQSVVVSIEAKKRRPNNWEVFIENGREPTGINVLDWVNELNKLECGEILLTSIDQEGTGKGFDIELCRKVSEISRCPVISSGGAGEISHLIDLKKNAKVSAMAMSRFFNIQNNDISIIRKKLTVI